MADEEKNEEVEETVVVEDSAEETSEPQVVVEEAAVEEAVVEAAVVEIYLADGSSLSEHVRDGRGTPGRPMSDLELDAKVNECAAFGAPFVDVAALIAAIRDIESMGDAAHIMRMTMPS